MHTLTLLGSTGSIGVNTLEVVREFPALFKVAALGAHTNVELLASQCIEFKPRYAVVKDAPLAEKLRSLIGDLKLDILTGKPGLITIASLPEVDRVVSAIVGVAGLPPTFEAVKAGKIVLLANKESLVTAGELLISLAKETKARLIPIDSEHSGLWQCLREPSAPLYDQGVAKLWLTASGGPFRNQALHELHTVTPEEACQHPTWSMGKKISVDSATLMNKAFELIEAYWLFQLDPARIEVVIHPESKVHALVEYIDGSFVAQMGMPDMRSPISYALNWPERLPISLPAFNLVANGGALNFQPLDNNRFPAINLARSVLKKGGSAPAIFNAANEVAVAAFLEGKLRFTDIIAITQQTLAQIPAPAPTSLPELLDLVAQAKTTAKSFVGNLAIATS